MRKVLFCRIWHFNDITPELEKVIWHFNDITPELEKVIGQGFLNFSVYFLIFSKMIPFTTAMNTLLLFILVQDNLSHFQHLTIKACWRVTTNFWNLRSEFDLLNLHEQ